MTLLALPERSYAAGAHVSDIVTVPHGVNEIDVRFTKSHWPIGRGVFTGYLDLSHDNGTTWLTSSWGEDGTPVRDGDKVLEHSYLTFHLGHEGTGKPLGHPADCRARYSHEAMRVRVRWELTQPLRTAITVAVKLRHHTAHDERAHAAAIHAGTWPPGPSVRA